MKHSRLFVILSIILSLFIIFLLPFARFVKPYLPFTNYLLGVNKPTSYLILLGNDAEMRANGGFAGSYAKLIANYPNFDLSFQDIYVPNGQLKGYVTPPVPIQEAFKHGSWELANADWEPDFPTTATTLRWFMEKGGEINPDNLLILNLTTIKKILDVVGTFSVTEYDAQITPDNLYLFLQGRAEMNFFPGSTQKKDTLTAVGLSFKEEILNLSLNKKIKIAKIIYQDLINQNLVINSNNQDFQNLLEKKNFAGKLVSTTPDTYLLVETNLGANKANAYVKRETSHIISLQDNLVAHKITVKFHNASVEASPNPPFHYGGDYLAYLRFYLPANAENINIDREIPEIANKETAAFKPASVVQKYGLTELGFWLTTPAQNETEVTLSYTFPVSGANYSLTILKQHGLVSSPQTIDINGQTFSTDLQNDFKLEN